MNYKFDKFKYKNGDEDLIIIMEDKKYQLVAEFLMSDIQSGDPSYVFEAIDEVLEGRNEYLELNGNVCGVEIHKDKTQIYDNLADDGMGNWCEVDTIELRKIVEVWKSKLDEFNKTGEI